MGRILNYFFTSTRKGAWWAHRVYEDLDHQQIHHDLPYQKIYRYSEMKDEAKRFLDEEKYYEASVLLKVLSDWELKDGQPKKFCNFSYD